MMETSSMAMGKKTLLVFKLLYRCSDECKIEKGWQCAIDRSCGYSKCWEICGDGLDLGHYECDDGNKKSGDGSDCDCKIEKGWHCGGGDPFTSDVCTPICGDKIVLPVEQCDDGNLNNYDGCSD